MTFLVPKILNLFSDFWTCSESYDSDTAANKDIADETPSSVLRFFVLIQKTLFDARAILCGRTNINISCFISKIFINPVLVT